MRNRVKSNRKKVEEKLEFYPNEIFKEIYDLEDELRLRYAISNYGRLVSFSENIENGRLVVGSKQDGYRIWRYRFVSNGKTVYKHRFYYRLVAEHFLTKTSEEQVYVLHLDRKRANDKVENLRLATKEEMLEHSKKSPYVIASKKRQVQHLKKYQEKRLDGNKLTMTQVMFLKKKLLDSNRKTRLKIIAKQYGITTMTLQRIKSGENWGHIKV
jgi:predicted DNA binding protein